MTVYKLQCDNDRTQKADKGREQSSIDYLITHVVLTLDTL